jgi:hypothetical protein
LLADPPPNLIQPELSTDFIHAEMLPENGFVKLQAL